MNSLRLAVAVRLLEILRKSCAPRVLDQLLLALLPLAFAPIYASSLCLMRSSSISSSVSACQCPWTAIHTSSSPVSPASRRNGDLKAGLGDCGGGNVARLLVDERVDPELEFPLQTALVIDKATLLPQYPFVVRP